MDAVFAAGPEMAALVQALRPGQYAAHVPDATALVAEVLPALRAGDVVLVKGSLGIGMARVLRALRDAAAGKDMTDAL